MIDNQQAAMALCDDINAAVPIPATATGALVRQLKEQNIDLRRHRNLEIKQAFYSGDGGGIMCDITPPSLNQSPIIVSITHLRVSNKHPLAARIRSYQQERVARLSQTNSFGTSSTTLFNKK